MSVGMKNLLWAYLSFLFFVIVFVIVFPDHAQAGVVFEDNFDSHADWLPTQQSDSISSDSCSQGDCSIPEGYNGWRIGGYLGRPPGHTTLSITSANARGGTGKAFTMYVDSVRGWTNDGLLDLYLGDTGYQDIYVRMFMKFQRDWDWEDGYSAAQKFLHIAHYDNSNPTSRYDFFSSEQNKPRAYFNYAYFGNGTSDLAWKQSISRYNGPYTSTDLGYFPPDGSYGGGGADWYDTTNAVLPGGMPGDDEWHSIEYHLKLNSADGVSNGVYEFWIDGVLINSVSDIAWVAGVNPASKGWNYVWLGGNADNNFSAGSEQWYSIDDLVISTEYIGLQGDVPPTVLPAQNLIIEKNP